MLIESPKVVGKTLIFILVFTNTNTYVHFRTKLTKKQAFWSLDHNSMGSIVAKATPDATSAGVDLEIASNQEDFLWQYRKECTKLRIDALTQGYEMVSDDQMPTNDITFAGWLLKNQIKISDNGQQNIMDFQAPIELEIMILPSEIT